MGPLLSYLFHMISLTLLLDISVATPLILMKPINPPTGPVFRLYAHPGLYPDGPTKVAHVRDPARGLIQYISYMDGTNGPAIYDGDVIFGTEQQLLPSVIPTKKE